MKQTLLITTALIITSLMLVFGCSKETAVKIDGSTEKETSASQTSLGKEPIDGIDLVWKDGLTYAPGSEVPYSGEVVWYWYMDNRQKEYGGTYKDGKPTGKWTRWNPEDGTKDLEGIYKDGKEIGYKEWLYYENGQKKYEWTYKCCLQYPDRLGKKLRTRSGLGTKHGKQTAWYQNGQKNYENTFKDGKKDGLQTWWYENGQKRWEGSSRGRRIRNQVETFYGKWTYWYENGQKEKEGIYKDVDRWGSPKKDGLWTYWSPDGKESSEKTYKNGQPWDGEFKDEEAFDAIAGITYTEANYREGEEIWKKEWEYAGSDSLSRKKSVKTYKNGKEDGVWTYWDINSQKKIEITYKDGVLIRDTRFINGQKSSERTYKDGKKIDLTYWDKDGNVTNHIKF